MQMWCSVLRGGLFYFHSIAYILFALLALFHHSGKELFEKHKALVLKA